MLHAVSGDMVFKKGVCRSASCCLTVYFDVDADIITVWTYPAPYAFHTGAQCPAGRGAWRSNRGRTGQGEE